MVTLGCEAIGEILIAQGKRWCIDRTGKCCRLNDQQPQTSN